MVQTDVRGALIDRSRLFVTQARSYLDASIAYARESTERFASALDRLETPVRTLHSAGTRLTELTQRYAAEMIGVQAAAFEAALDDGATRLRMAAKADDLRSLVRAQMNRLPASQTRISSDWRSAASATTQVGRDLRELAGETYEQLTTRATPRKRATAHKRKTTRKAAAGSKTRTRAAGAAKTQRKAKRSPSRKTGRARGARKTA